MDKSDVRRSRFLFPGTSHPLRIESIYSLFQVMHRGYTLVDLIVGDDYLDL